MNSELRKNCPMRHENGNCTPCGGFCTAVNDPICKGLHNAYDTGICAGALRAQKDINEMGGIYHLKELVQAEKDGRLWTCKVKPGETIFLIKSEKAPRKPVRFSIVEYTVDNITIGSAGIPMITACSDDNEWEDLIDGTQDGSEYFLTREEAQAALAEKGAENA